MTNEIVLYKPNEQFQLEVQLKDDTVWLTQEQIAMLFGTQRPAITKHLNNIYKSGELEEESTCSILERMGNDGKQRYQTNFYNLDAILSVGYRVNSKNATLFRRWASRVLREYILRGYAVNQRIINIENQLASQQKQLTEHQEKIDFFVRTAIPPIEKVFHNGEFFEARVLLEKIIKTAKKRVIIIDAYVDASTFEILDVRAKGITADIYSGNNLSNLQKMHNTSARVEPIDTHIWKNASHDRWLIVDDNVYHCGPSLKDMGQKLCAVSLLSIDAEDILKHVR